MSTRPPRTWTPSPDFVRAVLKGHSGLGLAFAAVIYIVCLTGTLAVFVNEFQRWENPGAPKLEQVSAETVQRAYVAALDRAGSGVEHVYIYLPSGDLPMLRIVTDIDGRRQGWYAEADGRLATEARESWAEFLIRLHINLHLPRSWGIFIVGLTGVALLSSLISGILAHPRIFRDAFHLRLGGSRRLQEADLHNRIGVWALPFHILLSLSGAFLGLTTIIVGVLGLAVFQGDTQKVYDLFIPPHPTDDARPAPPLDLRPMFEQVARRAPQGSIEYVFLEHPTEQGGAALFNVEDGSQRLAGTDAYAFDRSGKLYHAKQATSNNIGEQILGALGPLHFGWFGGGVVKIVYGLLGLGLSYLAVGGVLIWLARRRDKGRPAPGWERLWTATVWGQPFALAIAALGAILTPLPSSLPIWLWAAASLAMLAVALILSPGSLSRIGRGGTGITMIVLALIHGLSSFGADPIATLVDIVLALIGIALVATLFRRRTV